MGHLCDGMGQDCDKRPRNDVRLINRVCVVCGTNFSATAGKSTCGDACRKYLNRVSGEEIQKYVNRAKELGQKIPKCLLPKPKSKAQIEAERQALQKKLLDLKTEKAPLYGNPRAWVLQQEVRISEVQEQIDKLK